MNRLCLPCARAYAAQVRQEVTAEFMRADTCPQCGYEDEPGVKKCCERQAEEVVKIKEQVRQEERKVLPEWLHRMFNDSEDRLAQKYYQERAHEEWADLAPVDRENWIALAAALRARKL